MRWHASSVVIAWLASVWRVRAEAAAEEATAARGVEALRA